MPCYSGPSQQDINNANDAAKERSNRSDAALGRAQAELEITRALACDYCKHLEATNISIPEWALKWWKNHKRIDKLRDNKNNWGKVE